MIPSNCTVCPRCRNTPHLLQVPIWSNLNGLREPATVDAVCPVCGGQFIALVIPSENGKQVALLDLTYASTGTREPGPHDLPPWTPEEDLAKLLLQSLHHAIFPRERDHLWDQTVEPVREVCLHASKWLLARLWFLPREEPLAHWEAEDPTKPKR